MKPQTVFWALWAAAVLGLAVLFGALTVWLNWVPGTLVVRAANKVQSVLSEAFTPPVHTHLPGGGPEAAVYDAAAMAPGLTFVVKLGDDMRHRVQVIRPDGSVVHEWTADWFKIWPNSDYLPDIRAPKSEPGALIHGSWLQPDGSLIFNFEYLSTIKMDACSNVVWKLDNMGHHSVDVQPDGSVWVGSEIYYGPGSDTGHQNHRAPLHEGIAQHVSAEGEVLRDISTLDLFWKNDLLGFLFATNQVNHSPTATDDTMHLNDVEIFPDSLEEGVFSHGDILVSLRNINSVVVFDPETLKIKHIATGMFLRQHDPDFTSGDTYTVFDNRNLGHTEGPIPPRSRIVEVTASPDGGTKSFREVFHGPETPEYFTSVMGRHQTLPNGNVLIVVAQEGRILELTPEGRPVWEYRNVLAEDRRGTITEAQRLPPEMDEAFFAGLEAGCNG